MISEIIEDRKIVRNTVQDLKVLEKDKGRIQDRGKKANPFLKCGNHGRKTKAGSSKMKASKLQFRVGLT